MKQSLRMLSTASLLALATATAAIAGEIEGRVTESTETIGLEGAVVTIVETGQTTTTSRDGSYRFGNVPAGDYTVEVTYLGAETVSRSIRVADANSDVTANFSMGDDAEVRENILVVGQRGSLFSSLNRQRSADGVETVLSADAVGRLPDENVAEAVRRVSGVNVLNDQGEGRYVSIRGISPNQSSTTINGVRVMSPEADARQIPLDVIDSDILSAIVISKTLTPDQDGDTLGGNIEIETLSGLDQDTRLFRLNAAGLYDENVDDYGYRGSVVFADNFMDGRLGVAFSLSHQERKFGSDNIEVDGPSYEEENGFYYPGELEFRDYVITRERTSLAFNVDYQATENTRLYVNTLLSDFSDQEYRSRIEVKFEDSDSFIGSDGVSAQLEGIEVDRDIKDRLEVQEIFTIATGFEHFAGPWTLDGVLSFSSAEEAEPQRLDTGFRLEDLEDDGVLAQGIYGVNMTDPRVPRLALPDATGNALFYDASAYDFDEFEYVDGLSQDEETAVRFNARRDVNFGQFPGYVQGGFSHRAREKEFDAEIRILELDGLDATLADFQTMIDFPLDTFGPAASAGAVRDFFLANLDVPGAFELDGIGSRFDSTVEDYMFEEDVTAGYIMGSVDINDWRIVGGVRLESTDYSANATQVLLVEEDATYNGNVATDDFLVFTPITAANDYEDWLPSLQARYNVSEDVVFRAGYYASIGRPNANQIAPRVAIEQNDENEVEAEYGNPLLDRQQADNFDFTLEWYMNSASVLSGGIFFKQIDGFIADVATENVVVNGVTISDGSTFANLADADLTGIELNYQQALDGFSPWLEGFIVNVNYTYVDSETAYQGRTIALPQQAETVANIILGYENGPWDLRLAWAYRDEYIDELNAFDDGIDRIVAEHAQVDFSAKYDLSDQVRFFFEAKNLFDEPFQAVVRPEPGVELNSQYEEYGFSTVFGIQWTY